MPGGGVALVRALNKLKGLEGENEDQNVGISIARRAMQEPLRRLWPMREASRRWCRTYLGRKGNFGFNAQTEEYGDLVKMGILDPTKVVRTALQNAASIAGLLITTEATVAEKPKKDDGPAMPPGGMGGMDGMM